VLPKDGGVVAKMHRPGAGHCAAAWAATISSLLNLLMRGEAEAMPTYVYRCEQCEDTFEQIETISEHGAAKPACPKCGSDKVAGVPAPFVAMTGKKS
jgi:putative FmdB family regulatory protein